MLRTLIFHDLPFSFSSISISPMNSNPVFSKDGSLEKTFSYLPSSPARKRQSWNNCKINNRITIGLKCLFQCHCPTGSMGQLIVPSESSELLRCHQDSENISRIKKRLELIPTAADKIGQWNIRYLRPVRWACIMKVAE